MNLMNVIQVMGGLAIFIFGMKLMSGGLHRVAGERMRSILRMFSANRFVAVATGAVVTGVIQSSGFSEWSLSISITITSDLIKFPMLR